MRGALITAITLVCVGCSSPKITGQVVDPIGNPVQGAMITNTTGSLCTTESGADGRFELACSGENMVLAVVLDGWFSNEFKAMGAFDEEVGLIRLVKKAPSLGLWRWENGSWVGMGEPGVARREYKGDKYRRHWLEKDKSAQNKLTAGKLVLLDDSADDWRLWKIRDDGLIHSEVAPEPNRYETEYGEQPKMIYEQVEGGRDLITVDLRKGEYFLADWTNGKFNKAKEKGMYRGRWIVAN